MPEVLVDTSGWASAFVQTETHSAAAQELIRGWRQDGTRLVTTNYVITALVALLTSPIRLPRTRQVTLVEALIGADWVEVVHVDEALHQAAWNLLKEREDKDWSLVDCASFILMRERRIIQALTTDRHFEQGGFQRLLQ